MYIYVYIYISVYIYMCVMCLYSMGVLWYEYWKPCRLKNHHMGLPVFHLGRMFNVSFRAVFWNLLRLDMQIPTYPNQAWRSTGMFEITNMGNHQPSTCTVCGHQLRDVMAAKGQSHLSSGSMRYWLCWNVATWRIIILLNCGKPLNPIINHDPNHRFGGINIPSPNCRLIVGCPIPNSSTVWWLSSADQVTIILGRFRSAFFCTSGVILE